MHSVLLLIILGKYESENRNKPRMQGWGRRADAATANRLVGLHMDTEGFAGFAGKKRAPFLGPTFHRHPR